MFFISMALGKKVLKLQNFNVQCSTEMIRIYFGNGMIRLHYFFILKCSNYKLNKLIEKSSDLTITFEMLRAIFFLVKLVIKVS